jgi:GNAT superfamily N-acetyltransferase
MEFYTLPRVRADALPMFKAMLAISGATSMEVQTNMPLMITMFFDCATEIQSGAIIFQDACITSLECPDGTFRRVEPGEATPNCGGDWGVEVDGRVVASGGFLCHYNPPYGDVFMGVLEDARQRGYGSYLVQEVKRVCYEAGKKPAARCNATNIASRKTLQKAGFLPCGRMLEGKIEPDMYAY